MMAQSTAGISTGHTRSAGILLAICGFIAMSVFAQHVHAYEFCKWEHRNRVVDLWDGYPQHSNGYRDPTQVKLVKSVQQALRDYDSKTNYIREYIGWPDGYFGYATDTAVRQLQQVEIAAGSVDGRVGPSVRRVLCNQNSYLNSCRWVVADAVGTMRMNGCGRIVLASSSRHLFNANGGSCEATLRWLSGSGGSKTVRQRGDSSSITLATGVRNGARFSIRHNCDAGGAWARIEYQH